MTSNVKPPTDPKLAAQATEIMGRPVDWNAAKASQGKVTREQIKAALSDWTAPYFGESYPQPPYDSHMGIRRHGNGYLAQEARERET